MECLENIIGITKVECPCFTEQISQELKDKMKISKSGLYLDGLEGGVLLRNVTQIDKCRKFIEMQFDAIEEAKQYYQKGIITKLFEKYKSNKKNYLGDIGRMNFTGSLNTSKRLQFLRIQGVADGNLTLNRVKLIADSDITTTIWLIGMNIGDTLGEILSEKSIVISAGQFSVVELSAELPLMKNGKNQEYFIVWERNGANPRDTKLTCNCPGGNGYEDFVQVSGGEAEDFSTLVSAPSDVFSHGIIAEISLKCGIGNLVCKEYNAEEAVALATAHAIRYKAGELLIENILNSGEVNRYTMLSNERLWGKRNHFSAKFDEMINYVADMVDISSSDCFICRESKMFKTGIES